MQRFGYKQS